MSRVLDQPKELIRSQDVKRSRMILPGPKKTKKGGGARRIFPQVRLVFSFVAGGRMEKISAHKEYLKKGKFTPPDQDYHPSVTLRR